MDDTELKTILAMRCKEYHEEIHKRLLDRKVEGSAEQFLKDVYNDRI